MDPSRQVTNLLIALNMATYVLEVLDPSVVGKLALFPYCVAKGEWYRLVSCGFLHADILHLGVNMLSLHWLGPSVEAALGRGRFTAVYLGSILGSSLASYHLGALNVISMGASGGVFGLLGAYLVYRLRNRSFISWDPQDASWLAQIVGINLLIGVMSSGINHWAHLGGLLGGAACCWLIGPRYRWQMGRVVDVPVLPIFRPRR